MLCVGIKKYLYQISYLHFSLFFMRINKKRLYVKGYHYSGAKQQTSERDRSQKAYDRLTPINRYVQSPSQMIEHHPSNP